MVPTRANGWPPEERQHDHATLAAHAKARDLQQPPFSTSCDSALFCRPAGGLAALAEVLGTRPLKSPQGPGES
jgi:hypothetical protein